MKAFEISDDVYWVGVVDWDVRDFHGYKTPYGTSYNAYVVRDRKTAIIDTVYYRFSEEYLSRIGDVTPFENVDYVIVNHIEYDHSSALPYLMERVDAEILCTQRAKNVIEKVYSDKWDITVVKTGDELSLGTRTLRFIEAPLVHWPDTMFTYLVEDEILFPNDAFGQHIASSVRYSDELTGIDVFDEAGKYYANIVMVYSPQVRKVLEVLESQIDGIRMIAPSHGMIWRKDIEKIIQLYRDWSGGVAEKKVVIVYDTMWGNTEKMVRNVSAGLEAEGIEYGIYRLKESDWSFIMKEIMLSRGLIVGTPTLNREVYPSVSGFLTYMKGLKPIGKIASAIGSYGWSGEAVRKVEEILKEAGMEVVESNLRFRYTPSEEELEKCEEFGRRFAEKIKES